MRRHILRHIATPALAASALALAGCAEIGPGGIEAKIGIGPVKAISVEVGPGCIEAKGPSAGPVKAGH